MDLRGASAEALAGLTERLDDEIGTDQSAAALGDELFTVSRPVPHRAGSASLRHRRLPGCRDQAGHGPAGVQGPAVATRALDLLTDAVGRRWTLSRDLPDVLERLSEIAVVRSAGAKAGQVTDELFALAGIVDGTPELQGRAERPGPVGRRQGSAARLAARRQGARGHGHPGQAVPRRHLPHDDRGARDVPPRSPPRRRARPWPRSGSPDRWRPPTSGGSPRC